MGLVFFQGKGWERETDMQVIRGLETQPCFKPLVSNNSLRFENVKS